MAGRPVARALNPRGRPHTSLDADREVFEKNQITSITKAISSQECPVKQKHVRGMISFSDLDILSFFWLRSISL